MNGFTFVGSDLEKLYKLELKDRKPFDKAILKKKGENKLYINLRKEFPNNNVWGYTTHEYVEMLKKEITTENEKSTNAN